VLNENLGITFIQNHGDEVEQARLRFLLAGERPSARIIAELLDGQKPDGGFAPFWAPEASSLDATCFRIAQAEQLGLDASEPGIARAAAFLAGRQRGDGSLEEDVSLKPYAPPWAAPGDLAARLYLTANCGFWLGVLGKPEGATGWMAAAGKAAGYLKDQLDERGSLPSFLHANWLAAGLWTCMEEIETASRVCDYLLERLPDLSPGSLAWLLVTLAIAAMPDGHPLVSEAVMRLEGSQLPDGRWQSEDGPERDAHATLEALRAIRFWR
jgi:hypothetical protein